MVHEALLEGIIVARFAAAISRAKREEQNAAGRANCGAARNYFHPCPLNGPSLFASLPEIEDFSRLQQVRPRARRVAGLCPGGHSS